MEVTLVVVDAAVMLTTTGGAVKEKTEEDAAMLITDSAVKELAMLEVEIVNATAISTIETGGT